MNVDLRDVISDQVKAIPSLIVKDTGEMNFQLLLTRAQTNDSELLHTLYQNEEIRKVFFTDIVSEDTKTQITVFDNLAFRRYIELNDSSLGWTQYAKKVGLKINDVFLKAQDKEWSLVWPYKDCVLEGGQSAEEQKRTEIFFNKLLAHDEVTKLTEEKVLSNHKIYTKCDNSIDYKSKKSEELKELLKERGEKVSGKKDDLVSRLLESDNAKFESFNRDAADKERSLDDNTITDNLLIHGNNLMGMHTIKKQFRGKVKVIYFDPPYYFRDNKPGDTFSYNSNFKLSTWLTFMQDRLEVARELLHEDGVIFVSIDDDGLFHLKLLMDEIFGEKRFITNFVWKRSRGGTHLDKKRRKISEYVLSYGGVNADKIRMFGEYAYDDKAQPIVKKENTEKILTFPAKTVKTTLDDGKYAKGIHNEGVQAPIEFLKAFTVKGGLVTTQLKAKARFTWRQKFLDNELEMGSIPELSSKFGLNVLRHDEKGKFKAPFTLIGAFNNDNWEWPENNSGQNVGTNQDASEELAELLGAEVGEIFSYPKPSSLLRYLIQMVTHFDKNAIVLDAFAGSGTTGQAVMELNKMDEGKRQFILFEQMDYVETVTAERLLRSMEAYDLDESFRFIELKKWNESFIGDIEKATSKKRLAEIWKDIKTRGFLEYNFDMKAHEENSKEFDKLSLEEQKQFYCHLLDVNHLYVNLSSLDDQEFGCSEQEKTLTRDFYQLAEDSAEEE
tara:strand:- start:1515 stop:3689 length:2175 start_codon:yes stop_codon:yes gene_type:complete